jgi:drug/metabolite transporter (DMT)-like permease
MSWQIAVAFSIIGYVISILLQRRYSLKSKAPESFVPATAYLLGVMPVAIVAGLILPHHVDWSWRVGLLLFICASTIAISCWIGFKAIKLMPVAPYQTIARFSSIVVIALGWLVLGEVLNTYQVIGAALLLTGAAIAAWAPVKNIKNAERRVHLKAVILALIAAALLGISNVTEKAILGHAQIGGVLIFGWGSQTLAMLLLALKDLKRPNLRKLKIFDIKSAWAYGFANGVAGVFYVYSLSKSNNISIIVALLAITLPLAALGARFVLKERENNKLVLVSLAICFIGLLIFAI